MSILHSKNGLTAFCLKAISVDESSISTVFVSLQRKNKFRKNRIFVFLYFCSFPVAADGRINEWEMSVKYVLSLQSKSFGL